MAHWSLPELVTDGQLPDSTGTEMHALFLSVAERFRSDAGYYADRVGEVRSSESQGARYPKIGCVARVRPQTLLTIRSVMGGGSQGSASSADDQTTSRSAPGTQRAGRESNSPVGGCT